MYGDAAATTLIGRSASELLDQPLDVLVAARTDALHFARLVAAARGRREIGLSLRLAGGAEGLCLEIKGAPLRDDRSLYLLELRDVSELQALADAVRRHEIRHHAAGAAGRGFFGRRPGRPRQTLCFYMLVNATRMLVRYKC